ncbi:MAG: family 16 glycoside hydrolase [Bacteroidia bacterium]|nr:family 16 glycoside hydrolase [Bacteroidia bacterium]
MKKLTLLTIFSISLVLLFFNGCQQPSHSTTHTEDFPKVYRSVLDIKARMATVALEDSFWIAYDAKDGGLYKVWANGVIFDGAVFTTAHGPQPTSTGPSWIESPDLDPWRLVSGETEFNPEVQYRGHTTDGQGVAFRYELKDASGHVITITETPSVVTNKYGVKGLKRTFLAENVPAGTSVVLNTWINSVRNDREVETNGKLSWYDRKTRLFDWAYILEGSAKLTLNRKGSTDFTLWLYPQPTIVKETGKEEQPAIHPGLALIERSDCKTCHNETVKTIGPAYQAVAEKYPFTPASIDQLSQKVIKGGSGVWGDQAMTAHPDLMITDAHKMVAWILSLDGEPEPVAPEEEEEVSMEAAPGHGPIVNFYKADSTLTFLPEITDSQVPVFSGVVPTVLFNNNDLPEALKLNVYARFSGILNIQEEKNYVFRLISDDGSVLKLDGNVLIDHGGLHGPEPKDAEIILKPGQHPFTVDYFQGGGGAELSLQWLPYGESGFRNISPTFITHDSADLKTAQEFIAPAELVNGIPGDSLPLKDVHPAFDLATVRPSWFEPKVGGMDFLPDGRMVVSTWDPEGSVYVLDNIEESVREGNPELVTVKRIAKGLAEPLGLKVVDGEIYVLQKQELTHLIDHNGDEMTDEYRTICNGWRVSANFHEFAFGLVYKDGYFYGTLATAINPGGASTQPQIPDRGKVVRISKADGSFSFIASGLRTPNGIGMDAKGEIFVADNQGDWLPSSKILHIVPGEWYGSRSVDFAGTAALKEKPPVVWLPQDEIGNSPSQPAILDVGPYKGQMIHGEVTHGGIKRVFTEEVNGQIQGCLFRFTQGLEAGVNRLVWGPDGALYIGGVGNPGNWSHMGKQWFGLQRMAYNGNSVFEMLAVRAKSDGMEIEFTEPLRENDGSNPADYLVQQWRYVPTENYGGPKVDKENLKISSVRVSEDRKRVFLELPGIKEGHVVYIHLKKHFISALEHELWTTEAWYNLNQIPQANPGFTTFAAQESLGDNELTSAEKSSGWELLFDGKTTNGWRTYKKDRIGSSWFVENGSLTVGGAKKDGHFADGGDIITTQEYDNYELQLEWKIAEGGNSGVIYNVVENPKYNYVWETGPELQILDNERHPDANIITHRSGDLYDLISCRIVTAKPAGQWHHIRLIVNNGKVQHWQNGHKVVEYELGSEEWKALLPKSKWKDHPDYGTARKGHISLQDHGDRVWFKNIKIRRLSGV